MARYQKLRPVLESKLLSAPIRITGSANAQNNATVCRRCLSHLATSATTRGRETRLGQPLAIPRTPTNSSKRLYASTAPDESSLVFIPSDLADQYALVKQLAKEITEDPSKTMKVPDEKAVMRVLATYERLVEKLVAEPHGSPTASKAPDGKGATSAMLNSMNKQRSGSKISVSDVLAQVSSRATQIVEAPSIFITAPVLKSYINLQSQLERPQNFPAIFELYRNKPTPRQTDKEPYMRLAKATPNAASVAVDPAVASTALDAAIKLHSLPLCLDVIDSTYCAPAYAKGKVLRNAVVPLAGAALAPAAAYALASKFALLQNSMDPAHATTVAMAGIITYAATVGTMGYVAVTTSNDQMVRVTWATGMALWERWVREEERAAVDKVAQAWGFSSRVRWGDEEGPEWDTLREWAGLKGMVLDRVELMQGMQ